jgi:hypothetical protein
MISVSCHSNTLQNSTTLHAKTNVMITTVAAAAVLQCYYYRISCFLSLMLLRCHTADHTAVCEARIVAIQALCKEPNSCATTLVYCCSCSALLPSTAVIADTTTTAGTTAAPAATA